MQLSSLNAADCSDTSVVVREISLLSCTNGERSLFPHCVKKVRHQSALSPREVHRRGGRTLSRRDREKSDSSKFHGISLRQGEGRVNTYRPRAERPVDVADVVVDVVAVVEVVAGVVGGGVVVARVVAIVLVVLVQHHRGEHVGAARARNVRRCERKSSARSLLALSHDDSRSKARARLAVLKVRFVANTIFRERLLDGESPRGAFREGSRKI